MKKLIIFIGLIGVLVSCGHSTSQTTSESSDSTVVDSTVVDSAVVDSTVSL